MTESPPPVKVAKLHHHHRISFLESAKTDLVQARARVLELEKLVADLEQEEEKKNNAALGVGPSQPPENHPRALKGPTLQVVMGWLGTKDRLSCIKTCRQWKRDVDQQHVWEEAIRIQSPKLLKDIKALNNPSFCSFKKIAIGSLDRDDLNPRHEEAELSLDYRPSLRPADLFVLCEAKDRISGTSLGSWHFSYSRGYQAPTSETERIFVPFKIYTAPPGVLRFAGHPSFLLSCRLYRCDTGQSVGILHDADPVGLHDERILRKGEVMQFANNSAGNRALRLWMARPERFFCYHVMRGTKKSSNTVQGRSNHYIDSTSIDLVFHDVDPRATDYRHDVFQGGEVSQLREQMIMLDGLNWK